MVGTATLKYAEDGTAGEGQGQEQQAKGWLTLITEAITETEIIFSFKNQKRWKK